jgi:hypothetical protein
MGSYLTERTKIVGAISPQNINTNSGGASKPIKLDSYQKGTLLCYFGVISSDVNVKVYKGNTTTVGTAMAFNYIISNGAAAYCELNGTLTAATNAGITVDNATYPTSALLAIEVKGDDLGTNYHFVGINTTATASNTGFVSYIWVLSDARNPEANLNHATVIA